MTLPADYFDDLYVASSDPWSFRSRSYEARKRALTLASLVSERYRTVFEPGCSIGVLTAELAARSDAVLAMDISGRALEEARAVVPGHVDLRVGALPQDWPDGHFDLVVLSEVGYYLSSGDCTAVAEAAMSSAEEVIAVHWRHEVADYPLPGDEVHARLGAAAQRAGLVRVVSHVEEDLLLDVWARDGRSVATRAGMTP